MGLGTDKEANGHSGLCTPEDVQSPWRPLLPKTAPMAIPSGALTSFSKESLEAISSFCGPTSITLSDALLLEKWIVS